MDWSPVASGGHWHGMDHLRGTQLTHILAFCLIFTFSTGYTRKVISQEKQFRMVVVVGLSYSRNTGESSHSPLLPQASVLPARTFPRRKEGSMSTRDPHWTNVRMINP